MPEMEITPLPIKEVYSDADFNCRGDITSFDVIELARSIRENGLLQPIAVQPMDSPNYRWRIIMGHRRFKAIQQLGQDTVPCIIHKDLSHAQALTLNLLENLERKNLTVMQEARAIAKFAGMGGKDVAKMINKSYGWVQIRQMALRLPPLIQAELDAGFILQEHVRDLYGMPADKQIDIVKQIKDKKIRGEKGSFKIRERHKHLPNPFKKMPLKVGQMTALQELIQNTIGNNLATRVLACTMGEITLSEVYDDLSALATQAGKTFTRPR